MPSRKSPAAPAAPEAPAALTKAGPMPAAVLAKNPLPVEMSTPKPPARPKPPAKPKRLAQAKPPAKPTPVPPRKAVKAIRTATRPAAAAATTAAATAPTPPAAKSPRAKEKLVRDSFTMPRADFGLIQQLKDRALGFQRVTKKSELLRAGLQALADLADAPLQARLAKLATIKAGRPKKTD